MPTLPDNSKIALCLGYVTNSPRPDSLFKDLHALGHQVIPLHVLKNMDSGVLPDVIIWDLWETDQSPRELWEELEIPPQVSGVPILGVVPDTYLNLLADVEWGNLTSWLLRPVRLLQLQLMLRTLVRASQQPQIPTAHQHRLAPNAIFLKDGTRFQRLPLSEILYLEADRRYCKVVTRQKSHIHTLPLQSLLEQLPPQRFLRVHRSFAIQTHAVTALSAKSLYIENKAIPVGELYKEEVKNRFFQYMLKSG